MSVERIIASHLRLAGEALNSSRTLLGVSNRYAVYLVEQAVEQLVLALAQAEGVHYQRGQQHQLDTMVRMLPKENAFVDDFRSLTWLEAYATTFRYPKTKGDLASPPAMEKLDKAVSDTAGILERLASYFGVDLSPTCEKPARNVHPPRLGHLRGH